VSNPDGEQRAESRQSQSGVPSEGSVVKDRFSSDEVFQRIIAAADEEITSGRRELFFSGVAAGLAISITFLLYASLSASTDETLFSVVLYPIGFIYIIIGGYQLYTENTLPPVALTLERLASVTALLRNWLIVLAGNFTGGIIGAIVLAWGGVFSPEAAVAAQDIAAKGFKEEWLDLFFKGAFAGLIVAGVVWVEYAARDTISRLAVIYLAFLAIPLGNLYHVVVSFTEVIYLLLVDDVGLAYEGFTQFVLPVLLGNTLGGVVLVTVVNYYQTSEHRLSGITGNRRIRRLSPWEWLFGGYVGRAYVPVIEHHQPAPTTTDDVHEVMVPIMNPRTEGNLVEIAAVLAEQEGDGQVHLVHIVQPPRAQTLQYGTRQRQRIQRESETQLDRLAGRATDFDVGVETTTVVSHRAFDEIFTQAEQSDADQVVMSWEKGRNWDTLRSGRPLEELTSRLPCDFLVVRDRALDTGRILLPTAGGPDSDLSAELARALRDKTGARVTLLHVVDGPEDRDRGEAFLDRWAKDHSLPDAERRIDESGDVQQAIVDAAADHSLLLLGATERGMLARLAMDSLHLNVVDRVECSVILAERPQKRTLSGRLFGKGRHDSASPTPEKQN
jgi:formate/nitrite transporter FocA (FNT family)/nucleotide-binding universal stress UspA family protein